MHNQICPPLKSTPNKSVLIFITISICANWIDFDFCKQIPWDNAKVNASKAFLLSKRVIKKLWNCPETFYKKKIEQTPFNRTPWIFQIPTFNFAGNDYHSIVWQRFWKDITGLSCTSPAFHSESFWYLCN